MAHHGGSHPGFAAANDKQNRHSGTLIKPSHKGRLHRALGIPEGHPIPKSRIKAAETSSSPALRKEAQFADNFGHKK